MAKQIQSSPTTKKISDLHGMIKRGELSLQPEFQRKLVWNHKHKEAFIDTILNGYPFPEIYLADSGIDIDMVKSQQVVVDGQQRLSTIMQYIEDDGSDKDFSKIIRFKDLSVDDRKIFLNYDVVIRDLKDVEADDIKEIFKRINQTKFNLNQVEIANAVYDGEFISTAKKILDNFDNEKIPIFSENEISRMSDLNLILLLMSEYEENGHFIGDKKIDEYIQKYNDEYSNKDIVISIFGRCFNTIISMELPWDSIWFRKSNFYTLVTELIKLDEIPADFKENILAFEQHVIENKGNDNNIYGKYYSYMYTGTNSRTARVERGQIFRDEILQ